MSVENMLILEMLESGHITAKEALRLIHEMQGENAPAPEQVDLSAEYAGATLNMDELVRVTRQQVE